MNTYEPQKINLTTGKNEPFTRVPNSLILNSELNHLSKMVYILMSASLPNKGYSPSRHFKLKNVRERLLKQDGSPIGDSQFSAATQALREAGFLLQYHNQRTKEWSCKLFSSPLSLEERSSEVIECESPPPSIFYAPKHRFSLVPTRILQQNYPATETRKKLRYEFLLIYCYLVSKSKINDNFGIERISKDLRMSARMVRAGIAALEEWGIILEKPQRNHGYKEFFIFSTIDGCNNDEKMWKTRKFLKTKGTNPEMTFPEVRIPEVTFPELVLKTLVIWILKKEKLPFSQIANLKMKMKTMMWKTSLRKNQMICLLICGWKFMKIREECRCCGQCLHSPPHRAGESPSDSAATAACPQFRWFLRSPKTVDWTFPRPKTYAAGQPGTAKFGVVQLLTYPQH